MKYHIEIQDGKGQHWEKIGDSLDSELGKEVLNNFLDILEENGFNVRLLPDAPTSILAV